MKANIWKCLWEEVAREEHYPYSHSQKSNTLRIEILVETGIDVANESIHGHHKRHDVADGVDSPHLEAHEEDADSSEQTDLCLILNLQDSFDGEVLADVEDELDPDHVGDVGFGFDGRIVRDQIEHDEVEGVAEDMSEEGQPADGFHEVRLKFRWVTERSGELTESKVLLE